MRTLLALLAALLLAPLCRAQVVHTLPTTPTATSGNTFTEVQTVNGTSCSSSSNSCSVTISAIGAGHALAIVWSTGSSAVLSAASDGDGDSFTIPTGCQNAGNTGSIGTIGCAYVLDATGGSSTTLSITWSTATPGNPVNVWFQEVSYTGGTASLDSGSSGGLGNAYNSTASSSPTGVGLTVSGANLWIVQGIIENTGHVTAISGAYSFDSILNFGGAAHALNTTSGAQPTWTGTASATSEVTAMAIK